MNSTAIAILMISLSIFSVATSAVLAYLIAQRSAAIKARKQEDGDLDEEEDYQPEAAHTLPDSSSEEHPDSVSADH